MRHQLTAFIFLLPFFLFSQEKDHEKKTDFVITPEVLVGITADANKNFVEHGLQTRAILNLGWEHDFNPQEWAQRLKGPRTGISIGFADFGNKDSLGGAITILPFFEFNVFRKKNLKIQVGMGGSYFTKKYDSLTNPNNQGITTDLTWSVRMFMHYQLISGDKVDWRMGVGYFHHSNGHTRLPNQGLNSFLVSLSADLKDSEETNKRAAAFIKEDFTRSISSYVSFRAGYGNNVLSKPPEFNEKEPVYIISGEYGKILNRTFKLGVGFYYRFYQNYYNYIVDNERLVQDGEEFDHYKENPWWYASNIGLLVSGEVLLNHIGMEVQIGFNLHKPGYNIDWRINQGWSYLPRDYPDNAVLGEYNTKYKLKKLISTRMGIKYYLIGNNKDPKNNVFFAFHLNSNLGQADYTELSLGYVYNFNFKDR